MKYVPTFEEFLNEKYNLSNERFINESLSMKEYMKGLKAIKSPQHYRGEKKMSTFTSKSITTIPSDFRPVSNGDIKFPKVTEIPEGFEASADWNIIIPLVKELPNNCKFIANGLEADSLMRVPNTWNHNIYKWLKLDSIKKLPNGFTYLSEGNTATFAPGGPTLSFNSLASLPSDFFNQISKYNRLSVYLHSIKSLPEGFTYIDSYSGLDSVWELPSLDSFPSKFNLTVSTLHVLSSFKGEVEQAINHKNLNVKKVRYFKNINDLNKFNIDSEINY